jgi:choline dehydrogenase
MRDVYDYIIVGAGSAGCVLAWRLSENPRHRILLIESGPKDDNKLIAMPRGFAKLMGNPVDPHYWRYSASQGGNRPEEAWVKGRTLGGSSSINGMVYMRGTPDDYDGWQAAGCEGWGWDEMVRCFVAIENHQLGATPWRGGEGRLLVTLPARRSALGAAVIAAAGQAGTPAAADINDPDTTRQGGFGWQPRTIWAGRRFSAADAFLKPARTRPNLDVVTGTEALNIEFQGLRAQGVRVRQHGEIRVVQARAEIILSAGAINSPKLLQLSGIGSGTLLQTLGIETRVNAPAVGQNLREHRSIQIKYELNRGGHNASLRGLGLLGSIASYFAARRGALTDCVFDLGGFVKTMPGLVHPDAQIGVGLFSMDENGVNARPGMTMFGYFLRPESQGEVSIRSADPSVAPYINANYMATPADRSHSISLFRYIRQMARQPALAPFIAAEINPGAECQSDEDLLEASFSFGTPGYHVAGTCRMGSDAAAVLDPALRVNGVQGLRVVDTSIMPTMVSGNTNAPAMAIAWRAADLIQADG